MPVTGVPNIGVNKTFDVTTIQHPLILARHIEWRKWRLTWRGGIEFISAYLEHFTHREERSEFDQRKKLTYVPAYAKKALKKVRNRAFQRCRDIKRIGGPKSYQEAVKKNIDRKGSSMNFFMGVLTLEELLKMSIVGIYVDMPRFAGPTLRDKGDARPYVYLYEAEQIRSWTYDPDDPTQFTSLLLVDRAFTYDEVTNLPSDEVDRYRLLYLKDTEEGIRLFVRFFTVESTQVDWAGEPVLFDENIEYYEEQVGNLDKIPFVLLDIGNSVLADAANYQIAMMNMASGDVWFCTKASFPFYTEQYSPNAESGYIRRETDTSENVYDQFNSSVTTTNGPAIVVSTTKGRRYPEGLERPGFIHPSSEPLTASMAKQEQMKKEIEELVELTLQGLTGQVPDEGVVSGINYLTEVLQWAENRVAEFWAMYEGTDQVAEVKYPAITEYTDPADLQAEVTNLLLLIDKTPQLKLKKALMKKIARLKLTEDVSFEDLDAIYKEIDSSDVIIGDPLNVMNDVNTGLVSLETASLARGYPKDEADKAAKDHEDRLARIAAAQTPRDASKVGPDGKPLVESAQARGIIDQAGNMNAGKEEKADVKDTTHMKNPEDPTRGVGKDQNV